MPVVMKHAEYHIIALLVLCALGLLYKAYPSVASSERAWVAQGDAVTGDDGGMLNNFLSGASSLSFEPNRGQSDAQVKFLSRGRGYTLFLTSADAVLSLSMPTTDSHSAHRALLRMGLVGGRANVQPMAMDDLPGKRHYFIGSDAARWRRDIPTYGKVRFSDVYPGIDLVYYGNRGDLEYDFIVAPGADPDAIRLRFDGAQRAELNAEGDLLLTTPAGVLTQHAPRVYQDTSRGRREIAARYRLEALPAPPTLQSTASGGAGAGRPVRVRFHLAGYDPDVPLVIDPGITYASYLGGTGDEEALAVAADASGNFYLTGWTQSTNFPATSGAVSETLTPPETDLVARDAFITKFDAQGNLVYSTYLGGGNADQGGAITVDAAGRAYVTGYTTPAFAGFPTTSGAYGTSPLGIDAFVTVLDSDGSMAYSTILGGYSSDEGQGIALDGAGAIYIAGFSNQTNNTPFPATSGAFQTSNKGFFDAFVAKFKPVASLGGGASDLVYATLIGGTGSDIGNAIAVDNSGNAYVTGSTNSGDFPSASNAIAGSGRGDAFIAELNATGDNLVYARYLGGSDDSEDDPVKGTTGPDTDVGNAIAVDGVGNAYVTGKTASTDFPVVNAYQSTLSGMTDSFVAKIDSSGTLQYSTYLGGSTHNDSYPEAAKGIAVDGDGNIYITGVTTSTDFPITNAADLQSTFGGRADAFITKLNNAGNSLIYSTFYGAGGIEEGNGIALDGKGNVDIAGSTTSTGGISTSSTVFQASYGGGVRDGFVARISPIADLWLDLTDNEPVTAGSAGNLTYTITARNYGPDAATGAVVTVDLDASVTVTNPDICTMSGTTLTCSFGSLGVYPADEKTLNISVTDATTNRITATASVTANEYDPDDTNNRDTEPTVASTAGESGSTPSPGDGSSPPPILITDPAPTNTSSGGGGGGGGLGAVEVILILLGLRVGCQRLSGN